MSGMLVDPITLSVLQNGLMQVCNEMDLAFVRSAFSPVIAEALDRSDGIYHRETGELIAQGELGLPVFVGTMQFTVQAVIERVERLKIPLAEGDVFIVNDPYLGGTHLMDVKFVQPFFRDGRLWCWLANTGHWPDTGGMVPGGFSANATEVEQEGLRLPPVKLYKQGVLDDEILSIILSNIRIADQRIGDIKAQAAALATGQARLAALLDRYGDTTVDAAIVELKRRAARQMREKIVTIPDGSYEGEAFVDSDGVVDEPLKIAMRITKTGGGDAERAALSFDMSGSSPPCQGPMNSVIATTRSSIYLAVKRCSPVVSAAPWALMSPIRWSAMRMLLIRMARISWSIVPFFHSLTGGRRRPSCSTSVALAENPPGTMPPMSGQWPVLASQANSSPLWKNGFTKRTSIRWVPPR